MTDSRSATLQTISACTCWSAEEAEQMLAFLDALREDILIRYGDDIARQRHITACQDADAERQQWLELDEPAF